MTFDEVTRAAAHVAEGAGASTMRRMKQGRVVDEDDVTAYLVGQLQAAFDGSKIGEIEFSASVLRHRKGVAAEERRIGADLLIHVAMDTPTQGYSKGVLVQAKKRGTFQSWSRRSQEQLVTQCERMLQVTPAAFVFAYTDKGIRCGAATRVAGARKVFGLDYLCGWTLYRFFLELFRCPIGDARISSADVAGLTDLPVPHVWKLEFKGEFTIEEGASL